MREDLKLKEVAMILFRLSVSLSIGLHNDKLKRIGHQLSSSWEVDSHAA
jgi:hypothetical protein